MAKLQANWTWAPVPIGAIRDTELSPVARLVLADLWTYSSPQQQTVFPGIRRLAKDIGKSENTVRRAIGELKARGWIKTEPRTGRSNLYHLTLTTDDTKAEAEPLPPAVPPPPAGGTPPLPRAGDVTIPYNNTSKYDGASTPPPPISEQSKHADMMQAFAATCFGLTDQPVSTLPKRAIINISRVAKKFRQLGHTPDMVLDFAKWWAKNDWRGKKGQRPRVAELQESWGTFLEYWRAEQAVKQSMAQQQSSTPQSDAPLPADPRAQMQSLLGGAL